MDDIERTLRDIPARLALAEREPEPVRTLLIALVHQQEGELIGLQKTRYAKT
jgi:hypothetical protein